MLNLEQIQNYFPPQIRENPAHKKRGKQPFAPFLYY